MRTNRLTRENDELQREFKIPRFFWDLTERYQKAKKTDSLGAGFWERQKEAVEAFDLRNPNGHRQPTVTAPNPRIPEKSGPSATPQRSVQAGPPTLSTQKITDRERPAEKENDGNRARHVGAESLPIREPSRKDKGKEKMMMEVEGEDDGEDEEEDDGEDEDEDDGEDEDEEDEEEYKNEGQGNKEDEVKEVKKTKAVREDAGVRRPPTSTGRLRDPPCQRCNKKQIKCLEQAQARACMNCAKVKMKCVNLDSTEKGKVEKGPAPSKKKEKPAPKPKKPAARKTSAPKIVEAGPSRPATSKNQPAPATKRKAGKMVKSVEYVETSDDEEEESSPRKIAKLKGRGEYF